MEKEIQFTTHYSRLTKAAFTLAETLIVIGIIGVVAALTLPNLNHATGDKEKVTKVKKIYSALTDAVDRAQAVYGDFDSWFNELDCGGDDTATCNERFAKRVTEFMKVSKDCGFDEGCFSAATLLLPNGTDGDEFVGNYLESMQEISTYMVMLSDGISLGFCSNDRKIYHIRVDIDGSNKGRNQYGSDIFDFSVYVDKDRANSNGANLNQICPSAYPNNWTGDLSNPISIGNYSTAWVIQNGNLDYLKCPSELNWETQTSCK